MRGFECVLVAVWWSVVAEGRFSVSKGPFLQLPLPGNVYRFNSGAADKAAYDYHQHYLYVIGHRGDVLHVVDMTRPSSPTLLSTKSFNKVGDGLPNDVTVCRNDMGDGFLAVTFESELRNHKGHVQLFELLDNTTVHSSLHHKMDTVTTESYDPRAMAWSAGCRELVVVSEGSPHEINSVFHDPPPDAEMLIPRFAHSVMRRNVPIVGSQAEQANLRQVFSNCDSGSGMNQTSSFQQNLQPNAVHVDVNNTAYILFQNNNGIAKLDLNDQHAALHYFSLGTKDWSGLAFDGAYDDGGINLVQRKVRSFYQPKDMVSFELGGKVWLATADTGSIRRLQLSSCRFDESIAAASWRQQFADGMDPVDISQLKIEMAASDQLGRLYVSKLKTDTDGWDFYYQGYDYVTMYGGRGFSILDPSDMSRVYDSGDDFERHSGTSGASEGERAMFNANFGTNPNANQSSEFDRRSILMGPEPSAIAVGLPRNDTQVVVIANGQVGGLYFYTVTPGSNGQDLNVNFQTYERRGEPGETWNAAYQKNRTDAVGEPLITDLLFIQDQGQSTVVAVSSGAGALSFYSLRV